MCILLKCIEWYMVWNVSRIAWSIFWDLFGIHGTCCNAFKFYFTRHNVITADIYAAFVCQITSANWWIYIKRRSLSLSPLEHSEPLRTSRFMDVLIADAVPSTLVTDNQMATLVQIVPSYIYKLYSNIYIYIHLEKIYCKRFTEFSSGIFGELEKMHRVNWRGPWSIQIKQGHWLVILQWDPSLVYRNQTTLVT